MTYTGRGNMRPEHKPMYRALKKLRNPGDVVSFSTRRIAPVRAVERVHSFAKRRNMHVSTHHDEGLLFVYVNRVGDLTVGYQPVTYQERAQ